MRHRKKGRKLNRTSSHRKALLRNMVTTFIDQEQIETTDAKAKELRPLAERLVTLAKRGGDDLAARRRALRIVRDRKLVVKLFDEIGPRYAERPGGYTRIVKVETRRGDGAPLSILKFVTEPVTFKEKKHRPEEEVDRVGPAAAAPVAAAAPEAAEEAEVPAVEEAAAEQEEPVAETEAADEKPQDAPEAAEEEAGEAKAAEEPEAGEAEPEKAEGEEPSTEKEGSEDEGEAESPEEEKPKED
jgi:large subunit ribosomal protein L17